jgi:hypothetical protein
MNIKRFILIFLLCLFNISYTYSYCEGIGDFVKYSSNPIISVGTSGSWDDDIASRHAYYNNGSHHFVYYGGGADDANRQETSIGLAYGTNINSLTKHVSNPIISRADLGYDGSDEGIRPVGILR